MTINVPQFYTPIQPPMVPVFTKPTLTVNPQVVQDSFVSTMTSPMGIIAPADYKPNIYAGLGKPLTAEERQAKMVEDSKKPMYVASSAETPKPSEKIEIKNSQENTVTFTVPKDGLVAKFVEFLETLKSQAMDSKSDKGTCEKSNSDGDTFKPSVASTVAPKVEAEVAPSVAFVPEVKTETEIASVVPSVAPKVEADVAPSVASVPEVKTETEIASVVPSVVPKVEAEVAPSVAFVPEVKTEEIKEEIKA